MAQQEQLIKLLSIAVGDCNLTDPEIKIVADYLLANGVIVAPMPMAEWLKKELTEYVHQRCMEEL